MTLTTPGLIDLRSDTQTLPTDEMLEGMRHAELGDSGFDEDPTVNRLEEMAAEMMGKEAAMLVISGIMGNLTSMMAHTTRGDGAYIDPESHICLKEKNGYERIAGLRAISIISHKGLIDPVGLAVAMESDNAGGLLCLENTHVMSGGRVVPLELHRELCDVAHQRGVAVHLDGARIFNAAVAAGVPASAYAEHVDSLTFCLSKGLSCPLGSVVVGGRDFIDRARQARHVLGGRMRQAGIIAAAGIVALDTMIERLADDHANARHLAEQLCRVDGLEIDLETVESNMVFAGVTGAGRDTDRMIALLKEHGVHVTGRPPSWIRMVTNRHHNRATIDEAIRRIRMAMQR